MNKTISISEKLYNDLKKRQRPGQSFDGAITEAFQQLDFLIGTDDKDN